MDTVNLNLNTAINNGQLIHTPHNTMKCNMYTSALSQLRGVVDTIRYDTIEEFNVDSKAECDQRNLAQSRNHDLDLSRSRYVTSPVT